MYGFFFFVIRTSRGVVHTGQANIRFPFEAGMCGNLLFLEGMLSPPSNWILEPGLENAGLGAGNLRDWAIEFPHKTVRFSGSFP
jgi:hypothetical protein